MPGSIIALPGPDRVDISGVNLSPSPSGAPSSRVPKSAVVVMLVIVLTMALLALYANAQRWRRDKIENVTVIPASSPSPTAP